MIHLNPFLNICVKYSIFKDLYSKISIFYFGERINIFKELIPSVVISP